MSNNTSFRNARKKNFTQTSNNMLWDQKLSLEAKALLSIFLSNTDDWKIQMTEIIKRSKNGRDAHYRVLDELIEHGYIARVEFRNSVNNRFVKQEYIFSDDKSEVVEDLNEVSKWAKENDLLAEITYCVKKEKKKRSKKEENTPYPENQETEKKPYPENQETENQDSELQDSENQYINNNKSKNTNLDNTNLDNTNLLKEEEEKDRLIEIGKMELTEDEIKTIASRNIAYRYLGGFLLEKGVTENTLLGILKLCIENNVEFFTKQDIKGQLEHMMEKIENGGSHNGFETYFVNGLKLRAEQRIISNKHKEDKIREYEIAMLQKQNRDTSIYYNWLEE